MTTFHFTPYETRVDPLAEISCPHCEAFLEIHIPDIQMPDRLLGTSEECKSW